MFFFALVLGEDGSVGKARDETNRDVPSEVNPRWCMKLREVFEHNPPPLVTKLLRQVRLRQRGI
jgi:hypothetical protein